MDRYKANIYKKRHRKKTSMMNHTKWNIDHKTVLPISLRPKYIKKNEYDSMISIIDRCSKKVWLIKSEYKSEYYTNKIIYNYSIRNEIKVKIITVDNGLEFQALGLTIKKLGVKLYTVHFSAELTKEQMHRLEDLSTKETL